MRASRRRHGLHAEVDPARLPSCARPAGAEGRASQWGQKINQEADVLAHFKAGVSLNNGGLAWTTDHAVGGRLELLSDASDARTPLKARDRRQEETTSAGLAAILSACQ